MLDKDVLRQEIAAAFTFEADKTDHPEESRSRIADKLATAIDNYVKSATINYTSGLTAPNGPVTGTFNGGLE